MPPKRRRCAQGHVHGPMALLKTYCDCQESSRKRFAEMAERFGSGLAFEIAVGDLEVHGAERALAETRPEPDLRGGSTQTAAGEERLDSQQQQQRDPLSGAEITSAASGHRGTFVEIMSGIHGEPTEREPGEATEQVQPAVPPRLPVDPAAIDPNLLNFTPGLGPPQLGSGDGVHRQARAVSGASDGTSGAESGAAESGAAAAAPSNGAPTLTDATQPARAASEQLDSSAAIAEEEKKDERPTLKELIKLIPDDTHPLAFSKSIDPMFDHPYFKAAARERTMDTKRRNFQDRTVTAIRMLSEASAVTGAYCHVIVSRREAQRLDDSHNDLCWTSRNARADKESDSSFNRLRKHFETTWKERAHAVRAANHHSSERTHAANQQKIKALSKKAAAVEAERDALMAQRRQDIKKYARAMKITEEEARQRLDEDLEGSSEEIGGD